MSDVVRLPTPYFYDAQAHITIYCADNLDILPALAPASIHACITESEQPGLFAE